MTFVKRSDLFGRIKPFLTTSRQVVLAGDWNAVFDSDINRIGERSGTNDSHENPLDYRFFFLYLI